MSNFTVNLDTLKPREDLFKEVKYFVTGNLDTKVKRHNNLHSIYVLKGPHQRSK